MAGNTRTQLALAKLAKPDILGKGGFRLASAAFKQGEELDPCFTADEEDAVAPPLDWSAPPADAAELVLIVEDPDAAGDEPFCHWLVWGLAPQQGQLLEGEVPPRVGKNSFGNSEWALPAPPHGDEAHEFIFQLFALDVPVALMPGAGRAELLAAMDGHVIAAAMLSANYTRAEDDGEEGDWDDVDIDSIDFDGN